MLPVAPKIAMRFMDRDMLQEEQALALLSRSPLFSGYQVTASRKPSTSGASGATILSSGI